MDTTIHRILAFGLIAFLLFSSGAGAVCLDGGYTLDGHDVIAVYPDPNEANVVFALRNDLTMDTLPLPKLYKSCDAGQTWSATGVSDRFHSSVRHIAIDPTDSGHVVAYDHSWGLLRSVDGGLTWQLDEVPAWKLFFGADGTLYTWVHGQAFNQDSAIHRQTSASAPWEHLANQPGFTQIIRPHPTDASQMHSGAAYSLDGGVNWQLVETVGPPDINYNPFNPTQMIRAATPAQLSDDGGLTWRDFEPQDRQFGLFANGGQLGKFATFDGRSADAMWVATHRCGLWFSADAGYTWQSGDAGITGAPGRGCEFGDVPEIVDFQISKADPNRIYAVTSDGVFTSADAGSTWQHANGIADAGATPPPDGPFSGDADLRLDMSSTPKKINPPVKFKYNVRITNYGPDAAKKVSFTGYGTVLSSTMPGCENWGCNFELVPSGTTIDLRMQVEILGGNISARCNGDKHEIFAGVSALTNDPNPANNEDSASMKIEGNVPIISFSCPQDQLDKQIKRAAKKASGGGGAMGLLMLLLGVLGLLVRMRNKMHSLVRNRSTRTAVQ